VPAGTLVNGIQYKARVRTFSISGTPSAWSDWSFFWCFETPTVLITDPSDGEVQNQNYIFVGSYDGQDPIRSYKYLLYARNNSELTLVDQSPELFDVVDPTNLTYEFTDLENEGFYSIELITISEHEMEATSGLVEFRAWYLAPKLEAALDVESLIDQSAVRLTANLKQVVGEVKSGSVTYEANEWVILDNGVITYTEENGFSIDGEDFALRLWLKNLPDDVVFLRFDATDGVIEFKKYNDMIHGYIITQAHEAHYISNIFTVAPEQTFYLDIRKENAGLSILVIPEV
jgi:hypothetical protein